jgi:lysozyme family protein
MNILLDWPTIVSRTILHEGGYSNDPRDAGSETNFGISKRAYPNVDIKALTRDDAIYQRDYWSGIDQLQAPLAFQVFDFAVNAGRYRAIQYLQFVAGTQQDGVLGPATMAALSRIPVAAQVFGFIARVQQFYLENPQWVTYGKGWIDRWTENIQYAAQDFR